MLRPRRSTFRSQSPFTILLETVPPVFHIGLVSCLAYYAFAMNPYSTEWKVSAVFVVGQIALNWFSFLANKSSVIPNPKNFPGYMHKYPAQDPEKRRKEEEEGRVATCTTFSRDKWRECETCDMHVPADTRFETKSESLYVVLNRRNVPFICRHCGHCRRCINFLDHHCYFLGHCVGRTNMRFFIVYAFYASLGSGLGTYNLMEVMKFYRTFISLECGYYFLPYIIVMYMLGRAMAFEVFYVALINFGAGACVSCAFFFTTSAYRSLIGYNPVEERKKRNNENYVVRIDRPTDDGERGPLHHFREVFGDFGLFHFVFPFTPFEGQPTPVEGYRRVISYNHDFVLNGMVHTSDVNLSHLE